MSDPGTILVRAVLLVPVASAAMRAASCTPLPRKFAPTWRASEACRPMRTCGANPCLAR